jgi:hypothetical protein
MEVMMSKIYVIAVGCLLAALACRQAGAEDRPDFDRYVREVAATEARIKELRYRGDFTGAEKIASDKRVKLKAELRQMLKEPIFYGAKPQEIEMEPEAFDELGYSVLNALVYLFAADQEFPRIIVSDLALLPPNKNGNPIKALTELKGYISGFLSYESTHELQTILADVPKHDFEEVIAYSARSSIDDTPITPDVLIVTARKATQIYLFEIYIKSLYKDCGCDQSATEYSQVSACYEACFKQSQPGSVSDELRKMASAVLARIQP